MTHPDETPPVDVPAGSVASTPLRWVAAGFLGGAGAIGMLWTTLGDGPAARRDDRSSPQSLVQSAPMIQPQPINIYASPQSLAQPQQAMPMVVQMMPAADSQPAGSQRISPALQSPGPIAPQQPIAPTNAPTNAPSTVPVQPSVQPTLDQPLPGASLATRININTATAGQLDGLPQIGPVLAQRIIDYRNQHGPIRSLQDLQNVRGIGQATAAKLSTYIRFD